jgi:hypothetical protein
MTAQKDGVIKWACHWVSLSLSYNIIYICTYNIMCVIVYINIYTYTWNYAVHINSVATPRLVPKTSWPTAVDTGYSSSWEAQPSKSTSPRTSWANSQGIPSFQAYVVGKLSHHIITLETRYSYVWITSLIILASHLYIKSWVLFALLIVIIIVIYCYDYHITSRDNQSFYMKFTSSQQHWNIIAANSIHSHQRTERIVWVRKNCQVPKLNIPTATYIRQRYIIRSM